MALDFPSNPTEGQTFTGEGVTFRFTNGRWIVTGGAAEPVLPDNAEGFLHNDGTGTLDWQAAGGGGGDYLPLTGGTVTGDVEMTGTNVGLYLNNAGQNQVIRVGGTGTLYFRTPAGAIFASIEPTAGISSNQTLMTRAKGDARWLQLTGGVVTGTVDLESAAPYIRLKETDQATGLQAWLIGCAGGFITINSAADDYSSPVQRFRFDRDGQAGADVSVLRRIAADGRYSLASSDIALKENITEMGSVSEIVAALEPVNFQWKVNLDDPKPGGTQYGLIAQDVEQVLPSAVRGIEGAKTLDALTMIGVLVKAVQELTQRVAELENQT